MEPPLCMGAGTLALPVLQGVTQGQCKSTRVKSFKCENPLQTCHFRATASQFHAALLPPEVTASVSHTTVQRPRKALDKLSPV